MPYLRRSSGPVLIVTLLSGGLAGAQAVPAQYPPGQYPPGQYPRDQYPGGQYPTDRRLPGGLPFPDIKLPRRQPKEKEGGAKITVASVEGNLRKLGQKDLLLQTRRDVLRFRLLAKTQFRDKAGEPIRDSLLQPGDQISVQVNPNDEETAVRVILLRSGSSSDRAAAERPVPEGSIRSPRSEDLGKPRTVSAGSGPRNPTPIAAPRIRSRHPTFPIPVPPQRLEPPWGHATRDPCPTTRLFARLVPPQPLSPRHCRTFWCSRQPPGTSAPPGPEIGRCSTK